MSKPKSLIQYIDPDELEMLRLAPYEKEHTVRGTREVKIAQRLIKQGFLEHNPTSVALRVRCTGEGEKRAKRVSLTSARLHVQAIHVEVENGDHESASCLEWALHQRVLAEIAAAPMHRENGLLSRIALQTTHIQFRRG